MVEGGKESLLFVTMDEGKKFLLFHVCQFIVGTIMTMMMINNDKIKTSSNQQWYSRHESLCHNFLKQISKSTSKQL